MSQSRGMETDDALREYYERVPELTGFGPHLIATGIR